MAVMYHKAICNVVMIFCHGEIVRMCVTCRDDFCDAVPDNFYTGINHTGIPLYHIQRKPARIRVRALRSDPQCEGFPGAASLLVCETGA